MIKDFKVNEKVSLEQFLCKADGRKNLIAFKMKEDYGADDICKVINYHQGKKVALITNTHYYDDITQCTHIQYEDLGKHNLEQFDIFLFVIKQDRNIKKHLWTYMEDISIIYNKTTIFIDFIGEILFNSAQKLSFAPVIPSIIHRCDRAIKEEDSNSFTVIKSKLDNLKENMNTLFTNILCIDDKEIKKSIINGIMNNEVMRNNIVKEIHSTIDDVLNTIKVSDYIGSLFTQEEISLLERHRELCLLESITWYKGIVTAKMFLYPDSKEGYLMKHIARQLIKFYQIIWFADNRYFELNNCLERVDDNE